MTSNNKDCSLPTDPRNTPLVATALQMLGNSLQGTGMMDRQSYGISSQFSDRQSFIPTQSRDAVPQLGTQFPCHPGSEKGETDTPKEVGNRGGRKAGAPPRQPGSPRRTVGNSFGALTVYIQAHPEVW